MFHRETNSKKTGIAHPMSTLNAPWESISMDWMSILPSTKHGNDYMFVVIDILSKMSILIAWKKRIFGESTAKLFFKNVWVYFGMP